MGISTKDEVMSEHSGLSVKVEEENGRCFWIGAVSIDLPPLLTPEQNWREVIIEMESGERRHICNGIVFIMNAGGKTIGRVDLETWRQSIPPKDEPMAA
jgi:hypothetical protein